MDGKLTVIGDSYELRFERLIDKPVEKVWAALTVPERIADWLAECEIEPRLGGRYALHFRELPYRMNGSIHAFEPPNLLAYTWPEPGHPTDSVVRFLLVPRGAGCFLRLTQSWPRDAVRRNGLDHLFIQPSHYDTTLHFFTSVLGWPRRDDDNKTSRLASFMLPGGQTLVLATDHDDFGDQAKSHGVNGARPTIHFRVADVDQFYGSMPKGDHIVVEPVNTHWGTRWFVISDPDGNLFAFESARERLGEKLSGRERKELSSILSGWHMHLDRLAAAADGMVIVFDHAREASLAKQYAARLS
ncbi:MAG TPA: SRPBCC domain-containing protein [Alphaproteobacteria bacterium]|nr:SRPBCC domain-containing protein [Alphaproteobacteria bacterium]